MAFWIRAVSSPGVAETTIQTGASGICPPPPKQPHVEKSGTRLPSLSASYTRWPSAPTEMIGGGPLPMALNARAVAKRADINFILKGVFRSVLPNYSRVRFPFHQPAPPGLRRDDNVIHLCPKGW